ncbi:MAG: hypothetical protein GXP31_03175 [Kiritimatiellaeota bacterium]|nr:hypothetical protein [Kiritimatiellota bacterium]
MSFGKIKRRHVLYRLTAVLAIHGLRLYGDLYICVADRAPLYRGHRIVRRLGRGRIVEARRNPLYTEWLRLRLGRDEYDAPRRSFLSQGELLVSRARQVAALEKKLAGLDRDIEYDRRRAAEYFAAATSIRFDATIQYKIQVLVPVSAAGASAGSGGSGQTIYQPVFNYIDKVAPGLSTNLARRWERELDDVEDGLTAKLKRRREILMARARLDATRDRETRLFAEFARSRGDTLVDFYLTRRDRVQLFEGKRLKYELLRNTVVRGRPNPETPGWMRIQYRGGVFDARSVFFRSRTDIENEYAAAHARRLQHLADLNTEIDRRRDRERLLESLQLSLTYESNLTRVPLGNAIPAVGIRTADFYTVTPCPAGAVEVVVATRARSLIRKWDRQQDELRDERKKLERTAAKIRKDLALAEARRQQWLRFFEAGPLADR